MGFIYLFIIIFAKQRRANKRFNVFYGFTLILPILGM